MNESESSNDTVLYNSESISNLVIDENLILNLDYMMSLKVYFELEDEDNEDDSRKFKTVKQIFNFLKNNNKTNNEIINAIKLIYPNDDDINYQLERLTHPMYSFVSSNSIFSSNLVSSISNIFDAIQSNHIDTYTGDLINPSVLLNNINQNIFAQPFNININVNMDGNNLFTHDLNVPNFFINTGSVINQQDVVKNVATNTILNKNTKVLSYKELDEVSKTNYKACSICIDDYDDASEIRQLNCTHIFHVTCIDPWLLKESYKCPLCRDDTLPHEHI